MSKPEGTVDPAAEWVPLSKLHGWKRNPRKLIDTQVERVMASMREFGFGPPIVARKADGEIIAGHTRFEAARRLRIDPVPVRFMDLPADKAHALALADNRHVDLGEWDDGMVESVLGELGESLSEIAGFEQSMLGNHLQVDEISMDPAEPTEEKFFLSVAGPLLSQPDVLEQLRDALEKLPGVVVSMGRG